MAFLVALPYTLQGTSSASSDVMENYKKENDLSETVNPTFMNEVNTAIDCCDIEIPITVLESHKPNNSLWIWTACANNKHFICYNQLTEQEDNKILGLDHTDQARIWAIHHELGHIYHKHGEVQNCTAEQSKEQEREADRFAHQKLIASKNILPIITWIKKCLLNHDYYKDYDEASLALIFKEHPQPLERAQMALQELQNAGIDLKHLPIDQQTEIQEEFNQLLATYFPAIVC